MAKKKQKKQKYDGTVCPKCGCKEFLAQQSCRGTLTVITTLDENGTSYFSRNNTKNDTINLDELDFDDPEGPFECNGCGQILKLNP